jgi:glycosyltransferase involved in cell wall biosynthesis
MPSPLISVIIPVYNAARYVRPAVGSMLAQTLRDIEVIAVDDGSTDNSKFILESMAATDSRLRVITRPNTGIVGALNDALAVSRAALIARMDADDLAAPDRLEKQLHYLDAHPECIALGTHAWLMDADGETVDLFAPPIDHDGIVDQLLVGNGAALLHPAVVFRRPPLDAAHGYAQEFCRAEDLDLFFRLIPHGKFANLPEPLMRYRLHPNSTNFSRRREQQKLVQTILDRERRARNLPAFDITSVKSPADSAPAELHRNWACTACQHGRRRTAWKHALRALRLAPRERYSWQIMRYVLARTLRASSA